MLRARDSQDSLFSVLPCDFGQVTASPCTSVSPRCKNDSLSLISQGWYCSFAWLPSALGLRRSRYGSGYCSPEPSAGSHTAPVSHWGIKESFMAALKGTNSLPPQRLL